jgi:hypothetical protein
MWFLILLLILFNLVVLSPCLVVLLFSRDELDDMGVYLEPKNSGQ